MEDVAPIENEGFPACHVILPKDMCHDLGAHEFISIPFVNSWRLSHQLATGRVFVHESYWFQLSIHVELPPPCAGTCFFPIFLSSVWANKNATSSPRQMGHP